MTEVDLTNSYEHNLALIDKCIQQLLELKIELTKGYEMAMKEVLDEQKVR